LYRPNVGCKWSGPIGTQDVISGFHSVTPYNIVDQLFIANASYLDDVFDGGSHYRAHLPGIDAGRTVKIVIPTIDTISDNNENAERVGPFHSLGALYWRICHEKVLVWRESLRYNEKGGVVHMYVISQ